MSQFTHFSSVQLPTIGDPLYTLTEDLVYEVGYKGSGKFIITPAGTETDFASLPWIITLFWKKDDPRWINPAIMHDGLWGKAKSIEEMQRANEILHESMLVCGSPEWITDCFFLAVTVSKYPYFLFHNFSLCKLSH